MSALVSKKKNNKKYWYIVENKTVDGMLARDYVKNLGACTKTEANIELARYTTLNHNRGRGDITVGEAYNEFFTHYNNQIGKNIKFGTFDLFRQFSRISVEMLGHLKLSELEYIHIEKLKNHLSDKQKLSNRTVNMHLTEFKKILNYAVERGWMTQYPKIQRLSEAKANQQIEALTKEDFNTLLEHANPEQALYLQLMFYTGMRPNESANLQWKDVCLEGEMKDNYVNILSDNDKKRGRRVNVHPVLKSVLTQYAALPGGNVSPYKTSAYAFRALQRLGKRCGIKVNPYMLRKTFGSQLAQAGVDSVKVAKLMGHSDIQTTYQYYIHLNDDVLMEGIMQL